MAYRWVRATKGSVPPNAAPHGRESDGKPLWVCRAAINGGLYPGKVRPAFGAANVGWNSSEIKVAEYEVLADAGRWTTASGGDIPDDAEPFGREGDGERLYVVRAVLNGGQHLGYLRPGLRAALVPWGGRNLEVRSYQVLTVATRRPVADVLPAAVSGVDLPTFTPAPGATVSERTHRPAW
ncbi:DUF3421 domain-containing protein [Cryptosporangium phraense]|uniref:DUF3421 domain-containing protein n=1 Tax=Cryptosporangium phraense TaxID=2593070 RepID=A0A545AH90_9ACTN|nr:DUF3421 domain-containing protein [Cryptosporangium phraense]TQS40630.1 DUF3421 domain-containing protein [Cryptosporangium phraense]